MNWQTYCIANDDNFTWAAGDQFDETCFEILKALAERGFEIPDQENAFSEFGEKFRHSELAATYKERHLQHALDPAPVPADRRARPRM